MRVIGITGGVGAGKTEVLYIIEKQFQGFLILTDLVAHELMKKGQVCFQQMIQEFGISILDTKGNLDKSKLADMIFQDQNKRSKLNKIVHPAVKQEIKRQLEGLKQDLIIIESALLVEENYREVCDELWYVYAPEELRIQRLKRTRGYSEKKSRNIMDSQLTEDEFRRHCDVTIINTGTRQDLIYEISKYLDEKSRIK